MVELLSGRSLRPADALSWWAQALLIAAIAWGAFAFGAVYPWAYWPLASAAAAVAILSVFPTSLAPAAQAGVLSAQAGSMPAARPHMPAVQAGVLSEPALRLGPLAVALALFAAAVALQLVPVPVEWLRTLSARALDVVSSFDLAAGAHPDRHPLSIAPRLTSTGLVLFASFALLVVGSARLVTIRGPRAIAHAVAVIGVLLAMSAIIQKPLYTGKVYGFWTPEQMGSTPFGPFVNRNHFAGWMMMALPLTIGLLCGRVARGMGHVKPTFRDRVLWLSSPDASRLVLLAGAAAVMTLSLVLTLSRSAMAGTLSVLALAGMVTLRRQGSTTRRTIVASYAVLLVFVVTTWVGADTIADRFAGSEWSELNGRWGAWADAAGIFRKFPLAGTGLNTYGVATLFYQQHGLAQHYSAAHNDYLQLAAEGGLLLTIPAVLCAAALLTAVWKRFRDETSTSGYWIRVGAVTGLCAIALQETVDFSLQMPGNAVLFAVLCGIALHGSPALPRNR